MITVILRLLPGRDLLNGQDGAPLAERGDAPRSQHVGAGRDAVGRLEDAAATRVKAGRRSSGGCTSAPGSSASSASAAATRTSSTRTVDCYLLSSDEWVRAAPLRVPRDAPCAATDSESMFILGGWDCRRDKALCSAERASFDAFPRRADDPPPEASRDLRRDYNDAGGSRRNISRRRVRRLGR